MNRLLLSASLWCALLFATISHAEPLGINIIYERHRVSGNIYPNDINHYGDSYDIISGGPVQYELEWKEIDYSGAYSAAGNFMVSAFGAYACSGYASAESRYYFKPEFNSLELDLTVSWAGPLTPDVMFELTNQSTGTRLLSVLYDDFYARSLDPNWWWGDFDVNEQYSVVVNPQNDYMLRFFVNAFDSDWNSSIRCDISSSPVPEPSTSLLFGIGLAGLIGLNLRRKK